MALTLLEQFGMLFYIVSPNRTSFETIDEVPNYYIQTAPMMIVFIGLEQLYLFLSKRKMGRLYDMLTSVSQGGLKFGLDILCKGWTLCFYTYVYENYRIITFPWNSLWTWWICLFAVDFLYYWGHRACHEINILWATHQVHHSSEDYNFTTALRQSAFQYQLQAVFYVPLALAIPPSSALVHLYINLISQIWIHTEVITKLGPLEYILNTASHHRVHHGRNRYCIDKNYGGVLIIWDRMFGTFEAEDEPVVYGLTHNINSFGLLDVQLCHFRHIWKSFKEMKGWNNKISVLLKGPGWSPGKPRLGNLEDIPEIEYPVRKYDPKLEFRRLPYVIVHAVLILLLAISFDDLYKELPSPAYILLVLFFMLSLLSLNDFNERKDCSNTEMLRFMMFFVLESVYLNHYKTTLFSPLFLSVFQLVYLFSSLMWTKKVFTKVKPYIHPLEGKTKSL